MTLRVEQTDADEELLRLRFSVTDDGIGIQKERQKSIFNAFEQAEASTASQYGGTGLGLSISSRLVQMMGGKLEVESEPGKGSCFYFTLSMPFAGERGGDAGMEKSAAAADFSGKPSAMPRYFCVMPRIVRKKWMRSPIAIIAISCVGCL